MKTPGLVAIVLIAATGCEHFAPSKSTAPTAPAQVVEKAPEADALQAHMRFIHRLNQSNTPERNALYERCNRAFNDKPSINNQLELAWVLAAPGHAHSNPWQAGKHVYEVLAKSGLSKDLRLFANLRLREIERDQQMLQRLAEADAKIKALTNLEHSMEQRDAEVQEE
ncbi:MAG: hypothetical protein ACPHER_06205 [Nevskiales bacterium]